MLVLVVIAGWALMFAVLSGMLIHLTVLRGRRRSRKLTEPAPAFSAGPDLPAVPAQARHDDPYFGEQLLLDASQLICLVIFAAMPAGDEEAIRYLAAQSFWSTFFGRYTRSSARLQRIQEQGSRAGSRRQARLPADCQALAPELISLGLRQQHACIRVSFSQLRAVAAPGRPGPDRPGAGHQPAVASGDVRRGDERADEQFQPWPVVAVPGWEARPHIHPAARHPDRPSCGDRQPDLLQLRSDLPARTRHHMRALPYRTPGGPGHVAAGRHCRS